MNKQSQHVAGTIELRLFLLSPNSLTNRTLTCETLSGDDQKNYLKAIFKQEKDVFRPVLRKINNHTLCFEVLEGWLYVDTLIRFFKDKIPFPYETIGLFPDIFNNAGFSLTLAKSTNSKPYAYTDFYYSGLRTYKTFEEFINKTVVEVNFIE